MGNRNTEIHESHLKTSVMVLDWAWSKATETFQTSKRALQLSVLHFQGSGSLSL